MLFHPNSLGLSTLSNRQTYNQEYNDVRVYL